MGSASSVRVDSKEQKVPIPSTATPSCLTFFCFMDILKTFRTINETYLGLTKTPLSTPSREVCVFLSLCCLSSEHHVQRWWHLFSLNWSPESTLQGVLWVNKQFPQQVWLLSDPRGCVFKGLVLKRLDKTAGRENREVLRNYLDNSHCRFSLFTNFWSWD